MLLNSRRRNSWCRNSPDYDPHRALAWATVARAVKANGRLQARLRALTTVVSQLAQESDDDGQVALVSSERLQRALGFARRDSGDLEQGAV